MKRIFSLLLTAALAVGAAAQQTAQVAVFCINDFHCGLIHDTERDVPGAAWVVECLDSLKQVYPNHLTVAAGDNFGGSFFYTATQEKSLIPQFMRDAGIDISVPGNHAFDVGQDHFADRWQSTVFCPRDWKMRYVCANMRKDPSTGSGQVPAIPDYCEPWIVEKVDLKEGGSVNVAFTGLMTSNTPNQASASRIKGLSFDGNYGACLDSIKRLPGYEAVEKANARLLLTHISTYMNAEGVPAFDDPNVDELYAFDRPDIDGIFTAHSHNLVCGTIECAQPYPVAQGAWHGQYIAIMLCDIDLATGRCVKVTPKVVRVNPNATLSPKAARLEAQVQEQYQTTTFRGLPLSTVLTRCRETIAHDRTKKFEDKPMGRLVTSAYAEAYRQNCPDRSLPLVVGVSHIGGIRAGFIKGNITILDVGEVLPFANNLRAYSIDGKLMKQLMEFGYNGCRLGRIQTSGVEVQLDKKGHVKRLFCASPRGERMEIKDDTPLVIVADDFMSTGGDGYSTDFFPEAQRLPLQLPTITDAFIHYLKSQPEI